MVLNKYRNHYYTLAMIVIILLGFSVRWHFINTAQVINPIRGDAAQYFQYAINLTTYDVFSGARGQFEQEAPIPDNYRDPGYPLFLATLLKASPSLDVWYKATLTAQVLLGSLTILFTMLIANYWLPKKLVLIVGLFTAIWPHSVIFSGYLLTETLVGFLCTLSFWLLAHSYKSNNNFLLTLSGIILGSAALTNAILLPLGLILGFLGLLMMPQSRKFWVIFAISFLVLPSTWALRNTQLPENTGNSSSYRAYQNLVQGSWPSYHKAYKGSFTGDITSKKIMEQIDFEINSLAKSQKEGAKLVLERLKSAPSFYAYWYIIQKPILLWDWEIGIGQDDIYVYPTVNSPLDNNPLLRAITSIMHGFTYVLIALGFICILVSMYKINIIFNGQRGNKQIALFSCLIMVIYITGIYTLFQSDPRYSIPFKSFGFLLAITAAHYIYLFAKSYKNEYKN